MTDSDQRLQVTFHGMTRVVNGMLLLDMGEKGTIPLLGSTLQLACGAQGAGVPLTPERLEGQRCILSLLFVDIPWPLEAP